MFSDILKMKISLFIVAAFSTVVLVSAANNIGNVEDLPVAYNDPILWRYHCVCDPQACSERDTELALLRGHSQQGDAYKAKCEKSGDQKCVCIRQYVIPGSENAGCKKCENLMMNPNPY